MSINKRVVTDYEGCVRGKGGGRRFLDYIQQICFVKNISAVSIHPGWVKTDMGGSNAPLSPAQSVRKKIPDLLHMYHG